MKTTLELPIHTSFAIFSTKNHRFDLRFLLSRKFVMPCFKNRCGFYQDATTKIYKRMINQQRWRRALLVHSNEDVLVFKSGYAMSLPYIMSSWRYHGEGEDWVCRYIGFKRLKAIHSYQQDNAVLLGESIRVSKCKKRMIDLKKSGSLKDLFLC